ncbi:MAG: aminopeptidase P family protein [Bacteroides sp.]|jgi:Xaa-Pro aminopeptidase|nr:aminopeptidase P family protein [Bacteroides sp.]
MFETKTYVNRRKKLRESLKDGIVLILGNGDVPMNYAGNTYHFRQDSNFLYFFGIDHQDLAGVIDLDNNVEYLFGDDVSIDDIIWMGPQPLLKDKAEKVGVRNTMPFDELFRFLKNSMEADRKIHFLPPYRAENKILLNKMLGIPVEQLKALASVELIKAVVALREIKEPEEVDEIEKAIETGYKMHTTAMKMAKPGVYEREIAGVVEGIALSGGGSLSFPIILSKHGETLHNHYHGNKLEAGDLMVVDTGCETTMRYASDHTRTIPVGGKFSQRQKEIYEIVLEANVKAIEAIKPGVTYKSIHMLAITIIGEGLKKLGLMKGDISKAVELAATALFMPHGLGHMMGLDVHDMEDLGENFVGYDDEVKRSDLFGTAYLRLGKRLKPGFVLTVEPGIYFIPALIEQWEKEGKFTEFINYDKVKEYIGFGGIRIEDDVLVTDDGYRVLGPLIPKTVADVESLMV